MSLYIIDNNGEPVEITPSAIAVKGGASSEGYSIELVWWGK